MWYKHILWICSLFILVGCWDSHDIDQLSIEVGAALDKNVPVNKTNSKKNMIRLTVQIPKQNNTQQMRKKYINLVGKGDSILEIYRNFSLKEDRPPIAPHLKVMVISEELAKQMNLQMSLSLSYRTFEVRDSCILLISKGNPADEALKISEDIPAFTLIGIQNNHYKTSRLLPTMTLGRVQNLMASRNNYIIQSLSVKNGRIKLTGGALMKANTNRLIGFLNEAEVEGFNWITGNINGGFVKGRDPKTNGLILYEITSVKSKIIPHLQGGKISFDVHIQSEGKLNEDWVIAGNAFSNKFLKRAEYATKKQVEHHITQTLYTMQKQYKVDVAGFGEQLRIYYPREWEKIKTKWNSEFPKATIHYKVNITIDNYMVKGRKEIGK